MEREGEKICQRVSFQGHEQKGIKEVGVNDSLISSRFFPEIKYAVALLPEINELSTSRLKFIIPRPHQLSSSLQSAKLKASSNLWLNEVQYRFLEWKHSRQKSKYSSEIWKKLGVAQACKFTVVLLNENNNLTDSAFPRVPPNNDHARP